MILRNSQRRVRFLIRSKFLGMALMSNLIKILKNSWNMVGILAVGGVMAFLTLNEMLPLAFDYAGQKLAVKASEEAAMTIIRRRVQQSRVKHLGR